jgi:hypothetical protein
MKLPVWAFGKILVGSLETSVVLCPIISMPEPASSQLRIGQTGQLSGQQYRVAGWLVLAMEEDGVTYCWNEYHLLAPDGTCATLVEEQGKHGPEWRLFRLVEPPPISAAVAATKQVGDSVIFAGQNLRVTCVDESRVVRIEGEAPEGVEQGDVARYFNAESGNLMFVVSWTGDEVEVFRGVQLPGHAVYRAFGLKPPPINLQPAQTSSVSNSPNLRNGIVAVIIAIVVLVAWREQWRKTGDRRASPPQPPKPALTTGASGRIGDTRYRIAGRALVEIARVGARQACHEYWLVDENEQDSYLIQASSKSSDEWLWLRPVATDASLSPRRAATYGLGASVSITNTPVRVTGLFLSIVQAVDGLMTAGVGTQWYGLEGRGDGQRAIVRWTDNVLVAYRVTAATRSEIQALSGKAP